GCLGGAQLIMKTEKNRKSKISQTCGDSALTDLPPNRSRIRSMTGFARIAGVTPNNIPFFLSLKSVNHRFLDLQFHLPNGMDALEMQCRKILKEHLVRGHVEVRLSVHRTGASAAAKFDAAAIGAFVEAFRAAAAEHRL